jgi:hypothetical protein
MNGTRQRTGSIGKNPDGLFYEDEWNMTVAITKGKLIRWIITAFILSCGAVETDDTARRPVNITQFLRHATWK